MRINFSLWPGGLLRNVEYRWNQPLGILLTLLRGPDGQKILYDTLLVVQICTFLMLWHSHIIEGWSQHIVGCHNRFNNHCHTNFCIRPG